MAPSIVARYVTRRLLSSVKILSQEARAAKNVQNKETATTASIGARYITRRQLSSGDILSQEARVAHNVHTIKDSPYVLCGFLVAFWVGLLQQRRKIEVEMQRKKAERDGTLISLG